MLFATGINHHTAPIEWREKLSLEGGRKDVFHRGLRRLPGLKEYTVLDTCNRLEIFAVGEMKEIRLKAERFFHEFHSLTRAEFERLRYWQEEAGVVRHLLEVAAGIDSQMAGETEIFGQVKRAYAEAARLGAAGPVLHRLFQKSFQTVKWLRAHTDICRGQISIGNVAAELARRMFGDLGAGRALVIGTGEAGEKTLAALRSRGVRHIAVSGRRGKRAGALAAHAAASMVDYPAVPECLHEFDIVLCSTAAPRPVLNRAQVEKAASRRPRRPLFLIDLAVPRDVEPAAGKCPNVFLYNLDDLAAIANENLERRRAEIERCRRLLHNRAERLWRGFGENGGAPVTG